MSVIIAVGSENPVKVAAAEAILSRAFEDTRFVGVSVSSEVPDQPWGEEQTRQGAYNRAVAARQLVQADYGVGLEGGVMETPMGFFTCAWCVIVDASGRMGDGGGMHMRLPPVVVDILRLNGELGPAMDALIHESNTKKGRGAIGILTNGLSSRQVAYEQLVAMAAAPFVTGYYY